MSVAFLPFTTSVLASYNGEKTAVILYGINVIFSGLALYLHWVYASGKGKLITEDLNDKAISITKIRILSGIGFYVITTLLAFYSTILSLILFAALPFFYMIPSKGDIYFRLRDE